ncbi:polyphosphate kinase 1 [Alloacidobacterium dinghuense]|uniref:Polyphosphate kinase n=1 Tax=Alloacidobacterium dinghuense TaxID=2763107 RepID=A0A7G8BC40_9BACT|nr:polyphosphate kinase 1 [Alloacidobacterium dinghuense]QNI30110.1 polyphosphate kinase 1 [Alloacidobacterium dinghuense]
MATTVMASIGDRGALNASLSPSLSEIWIDRDLSWLDFNERVLAEALDERTPLLERAKFLAIFTSNLDEFFMKRQSVLRQGASDAPHTLLRQLREKLLPMLERQAECYRKIIIPGLAEQGVFLHYWSELTPRQQEEASEYFESQLCPALTPLVIDPVHPFPFISNLSTSLVFRLRDVVKGESMFARVKIPSVLKQWVSLEADLDSGQKLMVPLSEVVRANLHKLYSGMEISDVTVMRLTRDAEVDIDDSSSADFRAHVKEEIRQRRYEPVVRLEFGPGADPEIKDRLRERLGLEQEDLYDLPEEVDYTTLFALLGLPKPALRDREWTPLSPTSLLDGAESIFAVIHAGDILVHHPYDSFDASVEHFISAAADDPQTVSIKMMAYRIGDDTPFVKSLIRAAEQGKQVACVMEIKARFDEERNLHWATELERAGAHVTFGVSGLKTHAKTALVVRQEASGLRCYVHIGTGNYHVKTARLYADVGVFTCDPRITNDAVHLFHYLTGHADQPNCTALLVAPLTMRPRLLELIHREIQNKREGRHARIIAKMNQLEDPEMIEALCDASQAGVAIDLIIRGFCCLRPGVHGRTENIRVRSIIGRFLEHSRIFYFANGSEDPAEGEYFIGSADWMFRNLSKRIEVVTPVFAAEPKQRLWDILDILLRDQRQAWVLGSDATYTQQRPAKGADGPEAMGTHQTLMDLALTRAEI